MAWYTLAAGWHGDHLGSTSLTTDASGNVVAEQRYYPYGEVRWVTGTLPTDFGYTGQRTDDIGLMNYHARWYSPYLNRFISPDTIVPGMSSQAHNRYAYVAGGPLTAVDPSGHQGEVPELVQQAIDYFGSLGWQIVGDASLINSSWNGADLIFTAGTGEELQVLAVELKDVAANVNLGTLGKSARVQDYGGSLSRVVRSATRFKNSSSEQLKLMSQTILKGDALGTLKNALFTSSKGVSENAQNQFDGVYRVAKESSVVVEKALPELQRPGFWAKAATAASSAWKGIKTWGTRFVSGLGGVETFVPIIYLPNGLLDPTQRVSDFPTVDS